VYEFLQVRPAVCLRSTTRSRLLDSLYLSIEHILFHNEQSRENREVSVTNRKPYVILYLNQFQLT
jgi:hypothetical protein